MSTALETYFPVRHRVGDLEFVSSDVSSASKTVIAHALNADHGSHVHLLNAYSVALANKDPRFRRALTESAVNLPDGKPLSWTSKLRRDARPLQQIRGAKFFLSTLDLGQQAGLRHFLLGSTPETLDRLQSNIHLRFPDAQVVGSYSPPFRKLTDDEVAAQDRSIIESEAHLVWVGLGTPKQDLEAARIAQSVPVVAAAVGAAFDFVAGTVKEAPEWVSSIGLEWAYRFLQEPRRLWRRYIFGNARFLRIAFTTPAMNLNE